VRVCTICKHPRRAEIDQALVDSETYRSVAKRFGIGESAVYRHRKHLAEHLAKATKVIQEQQSTALVTRLQERETVEFSSARDLLARLSDLEAETRAILTEARTATTQVPCSSCGATVEVRSGSNDTALKAIGRLEGQVRLAGEILGALKSKLSVEVRVIRSYDDLTVEELQSLIAEEEQARAAGKISSAEQN